MTNLALTWEQKLHALKQITRTHLEMREPGDWYVEAHAREVEDGHLRRMAYGSGKTPEAAVNNDWQQIAESGAIIVVGGTKYRWGGFMWGRP